MLSMKLSLIIPVYKVEQYIEKCLQSIVMQLPQDDVEIIIVDDGSPDQSIQIANQFLNQQSETIKNKFKIISQKNQGVSVARNYGVMEAKGEYIAFLDSDDYLNKSYFKSLLEIIRKFQPDIIEFRAQRISDAGIYYNFLKPLNLEGLYALDEAIWIKESNQSAWFPWLRVYKTHFLTEHPFPTGMKYVEDAYTIPYVLLAAENIYFIDKCLIFYRLNPQSVTALKSISNIEDLKLAVYKMLDYLNINPVLSASTIALSQNYITDSLNAEGVLKAYQRWYALRKVIVRNVNFDKTYLRNRGNKLFLNFGIAFLLLCKILKK